MPYRFSGHETFPCRYAWLPKAYAAVVDDAQAFADEERAMIRLGVGKNMVRAIRFWMQASLVVAPSRDGGYEATALYKFDVADRVRLRNDFGSNFNEGLVTIDLTATMMS